MIPEKSPLEQIEDLYKLLDSGFLRKNALERSNEISDELRRLMTKIYPPGRDYFEQMVFSFVKVGVPQPPFLINTMLKKDLSSSNPCAVLVPTNMLVPLYLELVWCGLGLAHGHHSINRFSSFLTRIDPGATNNPPDKKQLKVLFQWFINNVDHKITMKEKQENGTNVRVLSWSEPGPVTRKYKRIVLPESITIKDMAYSILATGGLKKLKRKESMEIERT